MDRSTIRPEDILISRYLSIYNEFHEDIIQRLCRLHTSIIILEKIDNFPLNLFLTPHGKTFWLMVYWNFYHMAIVIIYSLVEKHKNTKNFHKFKNDILKNIKQKHLKSLKNKLDNLKFDDELNEIMNLVNDLRNKIIAHISKEDTNNIKDLSINNIKNLFERLKKLFEIISFSSTYYETKIGDFIDGTIGGKPTQSHLDYIYDLIVKDSYFFNEPEKEGLYWKDLRKLKQPGEIEILNFYRKKFGKPEV